MNDSIILMYRRDSSSHPKMYMGFTRNMHVSSLDKNKSRDYNKSS